MVKCKAIRNFVGQKNEGGFVKKGTKMDLPQERFDVLKSLLSMSFETPITFN